MQIKSVELANFKRFTHLTINELEDNTKLVLLIGSNGSGKSSVFDAFELANTVSKGLNPGLNYYAKNKQGNGFSMNVQFSDHKQIIFENSILTLKSLDKYRLYGRTSFRQVPRLTRVSGGAGFDFATDSDRPRYYIDKDERFENDLDKITENILKDIFRSADSKEQVKERYIDPINLAMGNIFGNAATTSLKLIEIIPPLEGKTAQINFKKGNSEIHYDYLSAGEKEVFNILINLLSRGSLYQDSVYFMDEIDLHLNTALQYALLKEITENWIPEGCQLWVASHSLGFIEFAQEYEQGAVIDFDDLDFDIPQVLTPLPKEKVSVYDIAIPKATISKILKGYKLVVVENKNDELFNLALGEEGYLFLPANNNREVFLTIKGDKDKIGLRDKDYLRPDEVKAIQNDHPNMKVLGLYTFENYLYHPDNIEALQLDGFDKKAYINELAKQKNEHLLHIVSEIGTSRSHYIEFKEGIKNDGNVETIVNALHSDALTDFYPYFNVKKYFSKHILKSFNLTTATLASTNWFKESIKSILA